MKAKLVKTHGNHYDLWIDSKGLYTSTYQFTVNGNLLSRKKCQAIERGYDLDELAKTIFPDKTFTTDEEHETPIDGSPYQWGFKVGFQKCLELMGDKKFTEKDMEFMFACGRNYQASADTDCHFTNVIQSLQQKEWDVEVVMECCGNYSPPCNINCEYGPKPKLDAEGCLILKLKSE